MPIVQNLLERKAELERKEAYSPTGEEAEYLALLKQQYLQALWYHQAQHRYFNDKSLLQYMNRADDDSFLYVAPTPRDNWHSKTRRQKPRDKFNAVLATILDQDLAPEVHVFDRLGETVKDAADVVSALLAESDDLERATEKRKLRAFELLKYGTCANEVSWRRSEKVRKPENKTSGTPVVDFEGVWTKTVPLNRVLLGDITKYFISEQPYIWKEFVITYDEAYRMFNENPNWKFVRPVGQDYDTWNDTAEQVDLERTYAGDRNYVRMRVYENKWSDEYAIILNEVLMTRVGEGLPTPDKEYTLTWTQVEPFGADFAYGRSFFAVLHNDSVILDFLYNALIDKARQGLEPPIVTSFKNMLNKNMFAPGKVSHGDVNFKRLVDHNGVTSADLEIARYVEETINQSSVANVIQGQTQIGGQTAYEIREQQKNALRMLGLTLYSIARMERDIAEKKLAYILRYYPELKIASLDAQAEDVLFKTRSFVSRGVSKGGVGLEDRSVSFDKMPMSGEETMARALSLMREEDAAERAGRPTKKFLADPEYLRRLSYIFQIEMNPQKRKSKLADEFQTMEDIAFALRLPGIDPVWATKTWLRLKGFSEDEALSKQSPQEMSPEQGVSPESRSSPSVLPSGSRSRDLERMSQLAESSIV